MADEGRRGRGGRFDRGLVLVLATADYLTFWGLYAFAVFLGAVDLDDPVSGDPSLFETAVNQVIEVLSLPATAVVGLTWYGEIGNALFHGFLGERVVAFFRYRAG